MSYVSGKIYDKLSLELKLVLICSRLKLQEKERETVNKLLTRNINLNLFLQLALHHQVYPLVYRCLSALAHPGVNGEVLSALRRESQSNMIKTLQMVAELVKILQATMQNGIRMVVMKGFPLAYRLYGDISLRPSRDLDILVWPEDVERTRAIIEKHGYQMHYPISKKVTQGQLRKWMETNQHFGYWHPVREIYIELHWRLDCHGVEIPMSQVEKCLTNMQIAGQSMNVLGKEELLLSLVLHGASHAWARLRWLCDIDMVIRQGDFSWERLYQAADDLGVKFVLNQAIILSGEIFATTVPADIAQIVYKDTRAKELAFMALPFIRGNDYKHKNIKLSALLYYHTKKYGFYLQSGWRKRLSFIARCFLPSVEDLEKSLLPENLYFMYYIISPFTGFCRRVRNVARRNMT